MSATAKERDASPKLPASYHIWVDLTNGDSIEYDAPSPPPVFGGMGLNIVLDGKNVYVPYHSILKVTYRAAGAVVSRTGEQ